MSESVKDEFITNRWFFHRLGSRTLMTTDFGSWIALDNNDFKLFRNGKFVSNQDLMKRLAEKNIITTNENIKEIIKNYRNRKSYLFDGVSLHIVSVTLRCNHSCIYCHAKSVPENKKQYDMDRDTARAVVDFIFQTPAKSIGIEFQGGEPLLNFPVIEYIIEYSGRLAKKSGKNVKYMLVSNLTRMDDDILRFLIKNRVGLCTSLDGPKEVHDKNRKRIGGGSYETVVSWIDTIKKDYGYNISALPVTTRHSLPYWKEIIDEYLKHDLHHIRIKHMVNAGFASSTWNTIGYSAGEFLEYWRNALDYIIHLNRKGVDIQEGVSLIVLKNILSNQYARYTCFGSPCGAALTQCAYEYNGDIYTCDESRSFDVFRLGNVKENTYEEVFTSPAAMNVVALTSGVSSMCDACVWHAFCSNCLVSAYGQEKSLISKIPQSRECKIRGGIVRHIFDLLVNSDNNKILESWVDEESKFV